MKKISKYFSNALFLLFKEKGNNYKAEIFAIAEILNEKNNNLFSLLKNKFLPIKVKNKLIENVFSSACSKEIVNFLKILAQHQILCDCKYIFNNFFDLCDRKKNVLNGIVYSTILLETKKMRVLKMKFSTKYNCEIKLINKIDYSLIGGIKVIINDEIYEYSILSNINHLKNQCKELLS